MLENKDFIVLKAQIKRAKELLPLKQKELKRLLKEQLRERNKFDKQESKRKEQIDKISDKIKYCKLMSGYDDAETKFKAYMERKNNGKKENRTARMHSRSDI